MQSKLLRYAAFAGALLSSAGVAQAQATFKVGFLYINSGPLAQLGTEMRDGYRLYWKERGLKVGDWTVETIFESEGAGKTDETLSKARKLVERDEVSLLTGVTITPGALAIKPYIDEKKIPTLHLSAGADAITQAQRSRYVFRLCYTASQAAPPLADWAVKKGYKKAVLMAMDYAAGVETTAGFARAFKASGGQVLQEIYAPLGADFAPYLSQVSKDADVVVGVFYGAEALRFVKQYKEYGLKGKVPLIGNGAVTDEAHLDQQGDDALGVVTSFHWSAALLNRPQNERFVKAYEAEYKRKPSFSAESGYAGAQMIAAALQAYSAKSAKDREALVDALKAAKIEAPRGPLQFDAYQNVTQPYYIRVVEKQGGSYRNAVIQTYPNVNQFWTWTPDQYMAMKPLLETKGTWAR